MTTAVPGVVLMPTSFFGRPSSSALPVSVQMSSSTTWSLPSWYFFVTTPRQTMSWSGEVHAAVGAAVALDLPLVAGPVVQELAEEGALERAVDDDVLQAGALGEGLVVVNLVEVAGAGGPVDQLLGGAVLDQLGISSPSLTSCQ